MAEQVNTLMDFDTMKFLDLMCQEDERTRSQQVRWLIRQEWERRQAVFEGVLASQSQVEEVAE